VVAWVATFLVSLAAVAGATQAAAQSSTSSNKKAAQKDYALIYGTVWGPDNRAAAGVPISIRKATDKKPKWELVSDQRGEFAQRVPVGTQDYIVQADIKTPKGEARPATTVHIDDNERKDISIRLSK
jgi:hypothetical protein